MAYKEVLFLICFTDKKKYFGIPYEKNIDFRPDNLFMWEINTVKQENSKLFRFIGKKIMQKAINIDNIHIIHEIVKNTLREA